VEGSPEQPRPVPRRSPRNSPEKSSSTELTVEQWLNGLKDTFEDDDERNRFKNAFKHQRFLNKQVSELRKWTTRSWDAVFKHAGMGQEQEWQAAEEAPAGLTMPMKESLERILGGKFEADKWTFTSVNNSLPPSVSVPTAGGRGGDNGTPRPVPPSRTKPAKGSHNRCSHCILFDSIHFVVWFLIWLHTAMLIPVFCLWVCCRFLC